MTTQGLRWLRRFMNVGMQVLFWLALLGVVVTLMKLPSLRPHVAAIVTLFAPFAFEGLLAYTGLFLLFAPPLLLMPVALEFSLIRCPNCGGTFFDKKGWRNNALPSSCKNCGFDVDSGE